ncbi:type II toxin-antitoxin system RelE/ParE family toxin [Rubrolithibacter danxiaensis]|uniref:type II toxin-antitoxin system RelE/ParE family toxin n=1 Tax=Rubrolithibacter danxiaensis TaxID=3390805 RepID=UPI003BF87F88
MKFVDRKILFHGSHFTDFYLAQSEKVQEKIEYVLRIVRQVERISKKFFDHMEGTDGLYEIRIEVESNIFRIFCCFDDGNIVILFNGFQKKTQKTPRAEIEKALRLKQEYFDLKNKSNEKGRNKKS